MKRTFVALMLALVLVGCGSGPVLKDYPYAVGHVVKVYRIQMVLNDDPTGTAVSWYALFPPTGFWYAEGDEVTPTNVKLVFYFQDVRGRDIYIPAENIDLSRVLVYNINDPEFFEELPRLVEYYNAK